MLKGQYLFIILISTCLLLQACDDKDKTSDDLVSETDRNFVLDAADAGLYQINAGQAAASNASNGDIRDFGQQMIDQHTVWNQELQALAGRKNIRIPTTLSSEKQGMLDTLSGQRNAAFDTTYVRMMVKSQSAAVQLFETALTNVNDAEIKDWTNAKLPEMRAKLSRANALNDALKN